MHDASHHAVDPTRIRGPRSDALRNRELILDAAARVFVDEPEPSLLQIAQAAGISRATVYRHFSDLAAIRDALAEDVTSIARRQLQLHLADLREGRTTLLGAVSSVVAINLPRRTRYAESMSKEPVPDAHLTRVLTPVVRALVKHAQRQGELRRDLPAKTIAEAIIGSGFYAARRLHRDGRPPEEAALLFDALLQGFGAAHERAGEP